MSAVRCYPYGTDVMVRVSPEYCHDSLRSLGFTHSQCSTLLEALAGKGGLIVFSGVTAAGKSTSLAAAMRQVATRVRECSGDRGDLDRVMRADHDAVMLGEISAPGQGRAVTDLLRAGHLVLTSVHASSPAAALERLRDLGADPAVLARSEQVTVAHQCLLDVLCPWCSTPLQSNELLAPSMGAWLAAVRCGRLEPSRLRSPSPSGCRICKNQAYAGRTACAAVITLSARDLEVFASGEWGHGESVYLHHPRPGSQDVARALGLVASGRVSPSDAAARLDLPFAQI